MRRLLLSSATLARTVASPGRPWLAVGNLAGQRLLLPPPLLRAVVAPKLGGSRNFSSRKHKGIGRKLPKEVSSFAHGSSADGALHFKREFLNSLSKLKCTGVCRRALPLRGCMWLAVFAFVLVLHKDGFWAQIDLCGSSLPCLANLWHLETIPVSRLSKSHP